jgi:hypothetical protein
MSGVQHVYTAVCLKSLVSADSSLVSLIDVVEQIGFLPQDPDVEVENRSLNIHLEIISSWTRVDFDVPAECQCRVEIRAPTNEVVFDREHPVAVTEVLWRRIRYGIDHIPLKEFGRHEVVVFQRTGSREEWGEPVAVYPLLLRLHTPPTEEDDDTATPEDE